MMSDSVKDRIYCGISFLPASLFCGAGFSLLVGLS